VQLFIRADRRAEELAGAMIMKMPLAERWRLTHVALEEIVTYKSFNEAIGKA